MLVFAKKCTDTDLIFVQFWIISAAHKFQEPNL